MALDSDVGRPYHYANAMTQFIIILALSLLLLAIAVIPALVGA